MNPIETQHLQQRYRTLQGRISSAAARTERAVLLPKLIAVSKTVNVKRLRTALDAGITLFGENYVQEFCRKSPELDHRAEWHFIGHLQRNKVRQVVGRVSLIHSVDSLELAREIGKRAVTEELVQPILLEVRLDDGPTRHGTAPTEVLDLADQVSRIPGVKLEGLMGMPPFFDDPEVARPHFKTMNSLFQQLPEENRLHLSMGMSADFEVAIEEGATLVRIGTALFGPRPGGPWTE